MKQKKPKHLKSGKSPKKSIKPNEQRSKKPPLNYKKKECPRFRSKKEEIFASPWEPEPNTDRYNFTELDSFDCYNKIPHDEPRDISPCTNTRSPISMMSDRKMPGLSGEGSLSTRFNSIKDDKPAYVEQAAKRMSLKRAKRESIEISNTNPFDVHSTSTLASWETPTLMVTKPGNQA
jgi:hypothetical protein